MNVTPCTGRWRLQLPLDSTMRWRIHDLISSTMSWRIARGLKLIGDFSVLGSQILSEDVPR